MPDDGPALVYLVGAGPGDPGLMTLRGAELLARADIVLHDKLVAPRLLELAPPGAEIISVEELPGEHRQRWPLVHELMIERARQGKTVVRLKGGDPMLFGRGAEETEALRRAGIPYEVVPGITAAFAASAYAEIPLTHRACSSAIALITGHENPTKPESSLDWDALSRFPGTLAIYMGMARLELIVRVLLERGKSPDTPAAVVQTAATGHQITRTTTLANLDQMVRDEGLMPPAIIFIGPVVAVRPSQSWFEARPLFGCRVLITRPRLQAAEMIRRLEELSAITYCLPAVEISDPPDWTPVDAAIERLNEYQWLVFTSTNGVERFVRRLFHLGHDLRALGQVKLAAIGPATAEALRRIHLRADVIPSSFRSEELAAELKPRVARQRVLLLRADRGRDILREELSPVAQVDQVAVYSQRDAINPDAPELLALSRGEISYVTFTSSNIARATLRALDETATMRLRGGTVKVVTISPVTSAAVRECGFEVAAEAKEYTVNGLIAALVDLAKQA